MVSMVASSLCFIIGKLCNSSLTCSLVSLAMVSLDVCFVDLLFFEALGGIICGFKSIMLFTDHGNILFFPG